MKNQTTHRAARKKATLAKTAQQTLLRRRAERYRILCAIVELIPRNTDIDGCAKGTLNCNELAAHVGVSGKAVIRALQHSYRWRVFWLHWKGQRNIEIRFERQVVEGILTAQVTEPRKVGRILVAHKKHREEVAPRRGLEARDSVAA